MSLFGSETAGAPAMDSQPACKSRSAPRFIDHVQRRREIIRACRNGANFAEMLPRISLPAEKNAAETGHSSGAKKGNLEVEAFIRRDGS